MENGKYRRIGPTDPETERLSLLYRMAEENDFLLEPSPTKENYFRLSHRTKGNCRPCLGFMYDASREDVIQYIQNFLESNRQYIQQHTT